MAYDAISTELFDEDQDEFRFETVFDTSEQDRSDVGRDALDAALEARGIETDSLADTQDSVLETASDLIETVRLSDIDDQGDVHAAFGSEFDIAFVDDFRTLDGAQLGGAATRDGRIFLDSDLEGAALREALTEEIAEAGFNTAFTGESQGDFGAEVVARVQDETDAATLANFLAADQNDTVETAFGTAQALGEEAPDGEETTLELEQYLDDLSAANGVVVDDSEGERFDFADDRQADLDAIASFNGENSFGQSAAEVFTEGASIDLNGNGTPENLEIAIEDGSVETTVLGYDNFRFSPIEGLSDTLIASSGDVTNTYVSRAGERHEVGSEFSVANGAEVAAMASFGFLDFGADVSGSASTESTETVTQSSTITSETEVRQAYTVRGSDYEPGTAVSFGWHAALADAQVESDYFVQARLWEGDDQNDPEGTVESFNFNVVETQTVEDYFAGVVATDVEQNLLA